MTVNYVAVGVSAGYYDWTGASFVISTSTDGVTWTPVTTGIGLVDTGWLYDVVWTGAGWVAVGVDYNVNPIAVYSADGISWSQSALPAGTAWSNESAQRVAAGGGQVVITGAVDATNYASVVYSTDNGQTWQASVPPMASYATPSASTYGFGPFQAVYFGNQWLFAVPWNLFMVNNPNQNFPALNSTADFATWSEIQPSLPPNNNGHGSGVAATDSLVAVGLQYPTISTSTDLASWSAAAQFTISTGMWDTTQGIADEPQMNQNTFWAVNGKFFAVYYYYGNTPPGTMAVSTDATTWTTADVPGFAGKAQVQGPPVWDGTNYWALVLDANSDPASDIYVYKSSDGVTWTSAAHISSGYGTNSLMSQAVACKTVSKTVPPTRQYPRDDNLALGAPRQRSLANGPTSVQNSYRQYPKGTYNRAAIDRYRQGPRPSPARPSRIPAR